MVTLLRMGCIIFLGLTLSGGARALSPLTANGCVVAGRTPYFTIAYGTVQLDGAPVPVGALVQAVNPRGDVVGCFDVTAAGHYGAMYVYGEDSSVTPPLPGMRSGEEVTFRVNGLTATTDPVLIWHNDRDLHEVDLTVTSAPKPVTDLSASALGSHLELTWSAVTHNIAGRPIAGVTYRVYRGANDPYFVPGAPHGTTGSTSFVDLNALGNPATNYTYVVTAVGSTGIESDLSDRVGEFDFRLTSPGYSAVALSLQVPSITDAQSLAEYVCDPLCVDQVWGWDASAQAWQFLLPKVSFGTNFATRTGGAYFLHFDGSAPAALTLVGDVPTQESITFPLVAGSGGACSFNYISLPLGKGGITDADELASDMGDTVEQVWGWNESGQTWQFRLPKTGFGTQFPTKIGYPYSVCLDSSAPAVWPAY